MADVAVTYQTYPFDKLESQHYEDAEESFGLLMINEHGEVFIAETPSGNWVAPRGHRNDRETEFAAAFRETAEETNVRPQFYFLIGTVTHEFTTSYKEKKINRNIRYCLTHNERPVWNRPGPVKRRIKYFVIIVGKDITTRQVRLHKKELKSYMWVTWDVAKQHARGTFINALTDAQKIYEKYINMP